MSYIKIEDENGNTCLLSLKRLSKVTLEPVSEDLSENEDGEFLTSIRLDPVDKDCDYELIWSRTSPEEIWDQIKLRM